MPSTFPIDINTGPNGTFVFSPRVLPDPHAPPGESPTALSPGAIISWSNNDTVPHLPGALGPNGATFPFFTEPLQPGEQSANQIVDVSFGGQTIIIVDTIAPRPPGPTGMLKIAPTLWQVSIDPAPPGGTFAFDPPFQTNSDPNGGPLLTPFDRVSWTNNDASPHWPGGATNKTIFMKAALNPGDTSPEFVPGPAYAGTTINYIDTLTGTAGPTGFIVVPPISTRSAGPSGAAVTTSASAAGPQGAAGSGAQPASSPRAGAQKAVATSLTGPIKIVAGPSTIPSTASVRVGDTISWHNADGVTHWPGITGAYGNVFMPGPLAPGATSQPFHVDVSFIGQTIVYYDFPPNGPNLGALEVSNATGPAGPNVHGTHKK